MTNQTEQEMLIKSVYGTLEDRMFEHIRVDFSTRLNECGVVYLWQLSGENTLGWQTLTARGESVEEANRELANKLNRQMQHLDVQLIAREFSNLLGRL